MGEPKRIELFGDSYRVVFLTADGAFVVKEEFVDGMPIFPNPVLFVDVATVEREGKVA